jgi:hypothetical protein
VRRRRPARAQRAAAHPGRPAQRWLVALPAACPHEGHRLDHSPKTATAA